LHGADVAILQLFAAELDCQSGLFLAPNHAHARENERYFHAALITQ